MKNKGITLIALVITIIVLLILAGVAIVTLTGDNGILKKATTAKEQTELGSLKEEVVLVLNGRKINQKTGEELSTLKEDLERGITGNKIVDDIDGYPDTCYVTRNGHTITVYEDGDIEDEKISLWDGEEKTKPEIDKNRNWHIYTPEEMKFFADFVNGKLTEEEKDGLTIEPTTTVYLEKNIDLGARQKDGEIIKGTEWESIGGDIAASTKMEGIFEGNNHTIKGIYLNSTDENKYSGIFGRCNIVQNLTVKDSYIKGVSGITGGIAGLALEVKNCHNNNTYVCGVKFVGGVVGRADLIVQESSNYGQVTGSLYTGGIVGGVKEGTIKDCTNYGSIKGDKTTGGIVGYSRAQVQNCENHGEIKGENWVAGIVGSMDKEITVCSNYGNITGNEYVGGIAGYTGASVSDCKNFNQVNGNNELVGGILGYSRGDISSCGNSGKVSGNRSVGGICGACYVEEVKIVECTNYANVFGKIYEQNGKRYAPTFVGGIFGNLGKRKMSKCINMGDVVSEGSYAC